MMLFPRPAGPQSGTPVSVIRAFLPNRYDAAVITILLAILIAVSHGGHEMGRSLAALDQEPVSLSRWHLPEHALRSTQRMFAAIIVSLIFTLPAATLVAKNRGWFFVVASEAITVDDIKVQLPGIGIYPALIEKRDLVAVAWTILAMGLLPTSTFSFDNPS